MATTYDLPDMEFEGLEQNYDHIYEALLEGATVYLTIDNYEDYPVNCLVTSWLLDPGYGLILFATLPGESYPMYFALRNGSYHTASSGPM